MHPSVDLWDRLENTLGTHAPAALGTLYPPATQDELDWAEQRLGVRLPDDIRIAYLRHNGEAPSGRLFSPGCYWGRLDEMVRSWELWCEVFLGGRAVARVPEIVPGDQESEQGTIRAVDFDRNWLPIGISNTPSCILLDLNPGKGGVYGQLLKFDGVDYPTLLSPGLGAWLEQLIVGLGDGKLKFVADGWVARQSGQRIYDWEYFSRTGRQPDAFPVDFPDGS